MATPRSASRRRWSAGTIWRIVLIAVAVLVAGAVVVGLLGGWWRQAAPPGPGTRIVASDLSKAQHAYETTPSGTEESDAADYLRAQPTAYWLTPEADPVDDVDERIAHLAGEARAQSATLAVVVYGLPGRDCGNHSAGGLERDDYDEWTTHIGDALDASGLTQIIVILEPDSLALAPECGNIDERVDALTHAVAALAGDGIWIYLDGGHSNWLPVDEMASLIARVGSSDSIRGFATNVSNYNDTSLEIEYAHELSARLDGMHAVIDTSRNGSGSDGEWCNPLNARVGSAGGSEGDDVVDTNLWIKPPGESDGACNGGPAAGEWWPDGAIFLTEQQRG